MVKEKAYVIGSPNKYVEEAVKRKCVDCGVGIWLCPWNLKHTPICLNCAVVKHKQDEVEIRITNKDMRRFIVEIIKRKFSWMWN